MKKKILSVMLFGAMCVGFVACENNEPEVNNNGNGNGNGSGNGTTNPITPTYTVTITINDEAMGTVTGAGTYNEGDTAILTATANEGYKFVKWSDNVTENSRTITVSADVTLTAIFADPLNGHEYVDLGLPSGILWATCNVGATTPEEYGNYYAWGETTTKETYNWSTYKYGDGSTFSKYNTSSGYGTVDNKTVLVPEDDAAAVNWGGDWRMPTLAEMQELLDSDNCTWKWTTQNGVYGRKVTGKSNGNSIFLPAAGYRNDSSLDLNGTDGGYWSSSLYESSPNNACVLYFSWGNFDWSNFGSRFFGQSVRAVCSPK